MFQFPLNLLLEGFCLKYQEVKSQVLVDRRSRQKVIFQVGKK